MLAAKLQFNLWTRRLSRTRASLRRHPWLEAIVIATVAAFCFGVGQKFSVDIFLKDDLSVCWPMVGIEVAVLLRIRRRRWPLVLCGIVASQLVVEWDSPRGQIIVDIVGDLAQVLIAAFALPPLNGIYNWIRQPNLLRKFVVWPMLLGPAFTGILASAVVSREMHISFLTYFNTWFSGDMLGIVLWLPLGMVLISPETYALFTPKALPRTFALIGMLSISGWALFQARPTPIAFMLMPLLLLIALRLGFSGSVIAVNILSIVSAHGTLHHLGPFGAIPEPYSVATLQLFLTFSMLMCFPVSIILLERDAFERESRDAYARMEQLAISDALTGLANRRRFDTVFEEEWRRALRGRQPIAVMMIDVDCFKLYNDFYGHLAGDECLRQIAGAIHANVKRAGDLAARFGGEEFVVLMPRTTLSGALEVAEMIRSGVESLQLEHERNPYNVVTVSIGCWSIVPGPNTLPDMLVEAADQGLYAAKKGGRNGIGTLQENEIGESLFQAS